MSSPLCAASTLTALVRALGGDVYAGGRRGLVPAPGHSSEDRSISLLLDGGRVIAHGFGGADWRSVLDDLRTKGWIDAENRLLMGGGSGSFTPGRSEPTRCERIAAARRIWGEAGAIRAGTPTARHVELRGVPLSLVRAEALRAHSVAPAWAYRNGGSRHPALVSAVQDAAGELTAVELTYLDPSGRRSGSVRPPRKIVGVLPPGCAVRLCPASEAMVVGEGVFTTLSAMRRFTLPGWALLAAGNLQRWRPAEGVRRLLIAADRGAVGERAAEALRVRARSAGLVVDVVLPPEGRGDWNDLDREEGGGRAG